MADTPGRHGADVDARALAIFACALLAGVAVVALLAHAVLSFEGRHSPAGSRPSPLAHAELPPEPRLQSSPPVDMEALRARQERRRTSYGWIDRGQGTVRIPIEEAKRLALERGFPVAPPGKAR